MSEKVTPPAPRLSARERLLAAANELFYADGINTVGIDRIIEHAGVAKASLYDCFGSKDELVRAYLQQRAQIRQARIDEKMSRCETPQEKILSVFDLLTDSASQPGYRGCAFARASADGNSSEGVKRVCEGSRAILLGRFADLAREAGAADPELLAKQLEFLYDGAAMAAYIDRDPSAPGTARALAAQVLSLAVGKTRGSGKRSQP
jgi:AcrR family transcriptional regulator